MVLRRQDTSQDNRPEYRRFRVFTRNDLDRIPQLSNLSEQVRFDMKVISAVLPFRVNEYVIDELIDWNNIPKDPIYQMAFPQRGMLDEVHFERMADAILRDASVEEIKNIANSIRAELNPHPAGQMELNIPRDESGERFNGIQHKYKETVLFFPTQGQTCHSYCTFCFRWAQFVGDRSLRIASKEADILHTYLREHKEVTDLLVTGGDPMIMKTKHLRKYLEPLLQPEFEHIQNVRIGTKALTFWPHRFVSDDDADDLLELLTQLVNAGKNIAVMAHYNHWRELDSEIAHTAIQRLRSTGAEIRSQGPLLAHINDNAEDWARLWNDQVKLGIFPYYMFVERDTGARTWFEVPLKKAWNIYREAMMQVSGLARTARGPSMSTGPGKVEIQGVTEIAGEKVFVLRFIQGRNPDWVQKPFFARYDSKATWLNDLQPAFGEKEFFFEAEYNSMLDDGSVGP
ncbi:MAG: lysine 2,3-aminomutase [Gammaproteobacteria bacterium]|nr:MAG: lysine 2,3-aminomutase [Gammaproteobacteria bacterium]